MAAVINVGIALNEVILSMEAQVEDQTQVPVFFDERFKVACVVDLKLFFYGLILL